MSEFIKVDPSNKYLLSDQSGYFHSKKGETSLPSQVIIGMLSHPFFQVRFSAGQVAMALFESSNDSTCSSLKATLLSLSSESQNERNGGWAVSTLFALFAAVVATNGMDTELLDALLTHRNSKSVLLSLIKFFQMDEAISFLSYVLPKISTVNVNHVDDIVAKFQRLPLESFGLPLNDILADCAETIIPYFLSKSKFQSVKEYASLAGRGLKEMLLENFSPIMVECLPLYSSELDKVCTQ
jgi:hypothetical protein